MRESQGNEVESASQTLDLPLEHSRPYGGGSAGVCLIFASSLQAAVRQQPSLHFTYIAEEVCGQKQ